MIMELLLRVISVINSQALSNAYMTLKVMHQSML